MCPDNHAQTSSWAVKMDLKKIYVPIICKNGINVYISNPNHTNFLWVIYHENKTINLTLMSI